MPPTADTSRTGARIGLRGTRIVYTAIVVFGAMCATLFAVAGGGEEGVRLAIRATARTSLALFAVVFCSAAVRHLFKSDATAWLLRNRRYLGLSVAVSHGYHLGFILALYAMGVGDDTSIVTVVGGSWGFLLLFLMAATSNDASQRRLRANWRRLHLLGIYSLWLIFAATYLPAASSGLIAATASVALLASMALRLWPVGPVRRARRGASRENPVPASVRS